jgi:hypothetical protein
MHPSSAALISIFYCQIRDYPNLETQVPVVISPRDRVAQLYPQALEFSFRRLLQLRAMVKVFEPGFTRAAFQ